MVDPSGVSSSASTISPDIEAPSKVPTVTETGIGTALGCCIEILLKAVDKVLPLIPCVLVYGAYYDLLASWFMKVALLSTVHSG